MNEYENSELISVDQALAKGRQMLLLPRIVMIIGLFFFMFPFALFFIAVTGEHALTTKTLLVFGSVLIVTSFIFFYLPFRFWSKRTTRWKLWAFSHVNDVEELRRAARKASLCSGYGSFLDNIQLQSASERDQWRRLQQRTGAPDVFIDDAGTDSETIIYYSRPRLLLNIFFYVIFLAAGIGAEIFDFRSDKPSTFVIIIGAVWISYSLYSIVCNVIDISRHEPRIILNDRGIFTVEAGFISWNDVFNIKITVINHAKRGAEHTLQIHYTGGLVNIEVTDYARRSELESLIRTYKGRFKAGWT
ncbi:hypothetical protein IM793_12540 [Pedobacter sp. MR2016-19]|uniref:hypothetical protein n=1 Tax=Pedobacter sp. MR2016-19 TaxID=2780089 RepID=UPI00187723AE|nr:hypothetical protein [Pedobacter sp. MR2016-19]MBE5319992.1 hypothetical protein [Pedobacter sp. MR2016-19]